jgi:tRNA threonylcarbamoyladenosine biosynthesis protein TsaB
MGILLALDTTSAYGSVALLRDGAVVEEVALQSPDGFANVVFREMEGLLSRHGLMVRDVDCFAGATGPGSFTGVRVGLTIIKGLGDAAERPVIGVSNLAAMAEFSQAPLRAVVLDARRGEVYGALYDSELKIVQPELVIRLADWLPNVPLDAEFVAFDFAPFAALLQGFSMLQVPRALAGAVGRIAWKEFLAGRAVDAAALDANYVRRSDAEILWKEM